ncbi:MAG TPA: hypothetical protein PLG66_19565, partial [Calditrichia bacterium]|nr:hypothetical protein [Calditrichia bacterium]
TFPVAPDQPSPLQGYQDPSGRISPPTGEMTEIRPPEESVKEFFSLFEEENVPTQIAFFEGNYTFFRPGSLDELSLNGPPGNQAISDFWAAAAQSDYRKLVEQFEQFQKEVGLNDWGLVLACHQFAGTIFPGKKAETTLFTWFLLNQLGYDVRVGYDKRGVFLLLPIREAVFQLSFLRSEERKFYLVSLDGPAPSETSALYTYPTRHPKATRDVSLGMRKLPALGIAQTERRLAFSYLGKDYSLSISINRSLIDFFSTYPQTELAVYFETPLSAQAFNSLTAQLSEILSGMSTVEGTNFLLRLVQVAFAYEKDDVQFGRERPLFAEETLFYPFSDCEDRSIFYALLVRHFLGLEVVGVDYPGHVATAVGLGADFPGDFLEFSQRRFVICDPTYINADMGMAMPRFRDSKPNVIILAKSFQEL